MTFDTERRPETAVAGFRTLESLNEQGLAPGTAFLFHPVRDVEFFLYVRAGTLIQESSGGGNHALDGGECRRSTVPSGTRCRIANRSLTDHAQVFACSITPSAKNPKIRDEKRRFPMAERKGILRQVASPDGNNASLRIRQDVRVYSSLLDPGHHLVHELASGRGAWLHVVKGRIHLIDDDLRTGDGASLVEEAAVSLTAREPSEILLFDLA